MSDVLNLTGTYDSATLADLEETRHRLASDPALRSKVEAEQRTKLDPGWSFWIDDVGFGHLAGPMYVSRVDALKVER